MVAKDICERQDVAAIEDEILAPGDGNIHTGARAFESDASRARTKHAINSNPGADRESARSGCSKAGRERTPGSRATTGDESARAGRNAATGCRGTAAATRNADVVR